MTTTTTTCTTIQNVDTTIHRVLQRHYSTIGIGNVFVCMNPNLLLLHNQQHQQHQLNHHQRQRPITHYDKWLLPCDYFSSTYWNNNTQQLLSICSKTNHNEIDDTIEPIEKKIVVIDGDEIIGQIKYQPEDFVVYEISNLKMYNNNDNNNNNDDDTSQLQQHVQPQKADIVSLSSYIQSFKDECKYNNQKSKEKEHDKKVIEVVVPSLASLSSDNIDTSSTIPNKSMITNAPSTKSTTVPHIDFWNIEQLQSILKQHLHSYTQSSTNSINDSNGTDNITTNKSTTNQDDHDIIDLFHTMEEHAIQRIQAIHKECHYDIKNETTTTTILQSSITTSYSNKNRPTYMNLTFKYTISKIDNSTNNNDNNMIDQEQQQQLSQERQQQLFKQFKTNVHECFRYIFPLLLVESCKNNNNNNNADINNNNNNANQNTLDPNHDENDVNHQNDNGKNNNNDANSNTYYYTIQIQIDTTFDSLIPYLYVPHLDLPPLYQYAKFGYEYNAMYNNKKKNNTDNKRYNYQNNRSLTYKCNTDTCPILQLLPNLPRNYRRPIHQFIDKSSNGLLGTETMNDYPLTIMSSESKDGTEDHNYVMTTPATTTTTAIRISWTKMAVRRANKKRIRDEISTTHTNLSSWNQSETNTTMPKQQQTNKVLCIVKKRQREHLGMINTISSILKCSPSDIGFAGMKDLHAITYQFGTLHTNAIQRLKNETVQELLLQRGIEIHPLYTVSESLNKGDLIGNYFEIIIRNVRRVQIQFNCNNQLSLADTMIQTTDNNDASPIQELFVPIDDIHLQRMVDRVCTYGFINFYGEQRVGDPGHTSMVGVRAFDIGRAMLQQNYAHAIDLLITGRRIIHGKEMIGTDIELFRRIWKETNGDPIATMKAMPTGNNSVPRERAILKGLVRYGTDQPLTAFRCLPRNERLFFINAYQSYVWNMMATERMQRYGNQVVVGDLVLLDDGSTKPIIVTESDLIGPTVRDGIKIENVVLPMPGYDTIYPMNEIGSLYQEFLQKEQVTFDKHMVNDESKARGSYRRLIVHAENLTYERVPCTTSQSNNLVDVKFAFTLPKGSYATMLLRELMLKTVARDSIEYS